VTKVPVDALDGAQAVIEQLRAEVERLKGYAATWKRAAMRRPKFELYKDRRGEFRWRLRAANGRVIADGAEGYKTKRACLQGIRLLANWAPYADVYFGEERILL
jgi:uncharacterized protein YegP (UPF0339 family)